MCFRGFKKFIARSWRFSTRIDALGLSFFCLSSKIAHYFYFSLKHVIRMGKHDAIFPIKEKKGWERNSAGVQKLEKVGLGPKRLKLRKVVGSMPRLAWYQVWWGTCSSMSFIWKTRILTNQYLANITVKFHDLFA